MIVGRYLGSDYTEPHAVGVLVELYDLRRGVRGTSRRRGVRMHVDGPQAYSVWLWRQTAETAALQRRHELGQARGNTSDHFCAEAVAGNK